MAEEETFLLVGLNVHRNQRTTRSKEDNILAWDARPLQIEALIRRVTNHMLKLENWVQIELGRSVVVSTDILAGLVGKRTNV